MRQFIAPVCVSVLFCVVSGCGPKKLSRGAAEDILNKVGIQQPIGQITVSFDQATKLANLHRDSLVKENDPFPGVKACLPDAQDVRIATGKFAFCQGWIPPEVTWQHPGVLLTLSKPIGWKVIAVTGMSDDSQAHDDKTVEYTWQYDLSEFPSAVAQIINRTPPPSGKSEIKLYDDGWRFVSFK